MATKSPIQLEVEGLQNCMIEAAHKQCLPKRFVETRTRDGYIRITDKRTGKSVRVGLCDLSGVRKTLRVLFGK